MKKEEVLSYIQEKQVLDRQVQALNNQRSALSAKLLEIAIRYKTHVEENNPLLISTCISSVLSPTMPYENGVMLFTYEEHTPETLALYGNMTKVAKQRFWVPWEALDAETADEYFNKWVEDYEETVKRNQQIYDDNCNVMSAWEGYSKEDIAVLKSLLDECLSSANQEGSFEIKGVRHGKLIVAFDIVRVEEDEYIGFAGY